MCVIYVYRQGIDILVSKIESFGSDADSATSSVISITAHLSLMCSSVTFFLKSGSWERERERTFNTQHSIHCVSLTLFSSSGKSSR